MCRRLSVFALFLLTPLPAVSAGEKTPSESATLLDAEALAQRIDRHLAARLKEKGVPPAARTDDAAFLRRVYLDLAGCIPSIIDVRDFLDDTRPHKRRLWVEMILNGKKPSRKPEAFAQHFANVYRAWILARVNSENAASFAPILETWLRERLKANTPYDRMVRGLIAAPVDPGGMSGNVFYPINENKPENLAASVSRLFLGVKLECAQCHDDRSGGNWTQEQFWAFAAFFAGNNLEGETTNKREILIPGRKKTIAARFLDDSQPNWMNNDNPRAVLADWLVDANNPYFARAAVNRLWAYFFGVGLTDPLDEQGTHNPPSHPELLDELAQQFAEHNFDLQYLMRAFVATEAYQRSSVAEQAGQRDPRLFACMPIRGLSAEQLFDSLAEATEYQDTSPGAINRFGKPENMSPRRKFLARFAHQDKPMEAPTSILQALYLMNSAFVAERTSLEQNKTLATIADAAKTDTVRRVETLFLVVLSRKPTAAESKRFVSYVERSGPSSERRHALADMFWALLNSAEFRLNH